MSGSAGTPPLLSLLLPLWTPPPRRRQCAHIATPVAAAFPPPPPTNTTAAPFPSPPGSRAGQAVLLPLKPPYNSAQLLLTGGSVKDFADSSVSASGRAFVIDLMAGSNAAWKNVGPMPYKRVMGDAVLLCDGTVMHVGGAGGGESVAACCGWGGGGGVGARVPPTPQAAGAGRVARLRRLARTHQAPPLPCAGTAGYYNPDAAEKITIGTDGTT